MDVVVIVLLVLLGVIALAKGKPLWNRWRSYWIHWDDALLFLVWAVIQLVWGVWMLWGTEDGMGIEKNWMIGTFTGLALLFLMILKWPKIDV
jgi:hypothetical protein